MAKNDIVIIDNIIQERIDECHPSKDKGEVFELLANEQILKNLDLSYDEILSGMVDGQNDGGIDSFYILINGCLLSDSSDFVWPKKNADIDVYIITCKHHSTFEQAVINSECTTISELFDLSLEPQDIKALYNAKILNQRKLFVEAFRRTAAIMQNLSFHFYYASRGDTSCVGENIIAKTVFLKNIVLDYFSSCQVEYDFVGSSEILTLYRKKPQYNLTIPYRGVISYDAECCILLCNLYDYYQFITDENGKLRTYLFDSNVRDFMGDNHVNQDIMKALVNDKNIDFWWLNNGITFLASSSVDVGKKLNVQDIQIVNGLQTSHSIYKYFVESQSVQDDRCVMIKIITQMDSAIRDSIIRSTNNQTAVEVSSLFATDKIQRDIEDVLKKYGFFYERRKNCYANLDIDEEKILTMQFLASGYVCLVLKKINQATNLKQKVFKNEITYNEIFNPKVSLLVWPKIAFILKTVDRVIRKKYEGSDIQKKYKWYRMITAYISTSRVFGTYNFSIQKLIDLEESLFTDDIINDTYTAIKNTIDLKFKKGVHNPSYTNQILEGAVVSWNIKDIDKIINHKTVLSKNNKVSINESITEEIINNVLHYLPSKPCLYYMMINNIKKRTKYSKNLIEATIDILVSRGLLFYKDEKMYDSVRNLICYLRSKVEVLMSEDLLKNVIDNLPSEPTEYQKMLSNIAVQIGQSELAIIDALTILIEREILCKVDGNIYNSEHKLICYLKPND